MVLKSLAQLDIFRLRILALRRCWLRTRLGVVIDATSQVSMSSRIVSGGRGSLTIDRESIVAFKTLLITRDQGGVCQPIRIGTRCFIGGGSLIMPGITIGDGSVVAAGSVVFEDVPSGCIVGGNPARILRSGIKTEHFGRFAGVVGNDGWSARHGGR